MVNIMKKIGIYKIINVINKKEYIGSSKNIVNRFNIHKNKLNLGKHINIHLQRAWDKYGNINFSFEIIEECEIENLLVIEQKYLDNIKVWKNVYNISKEATGGNLIFNHPNKEEIIKKITKHLLKYNNNLPLEERKKRSKKMLGENNINFNGKSNRNVVVGNKISKGLIEYYKDNNSYRKGKSFDELFDLEMSERLKNNLSKCAKNRVGEKNGFYNKNHTEKFKNELSEYRKGKYFGNQNKKFYIEGVEYMSLGDASKKLNIHITTISYRLKSKNKKFEKYKYKNE